MDNYARMQFDVLLATAAESFVERIVQRCAGTDEALSRLAADPDGDGIWLSQFVDSVFAENCLDDPAGSCFVLEALSRRPIELAMSGTVADVLARAARMAFADLLRSKVTEAMERAQRYG
ncbi:hypothetical protein ACWDTI_04745 [Gordonia sp. NPDC003424]